MSLAINVDCVASVLLSNGEWIGVEFNDNGVSTFDLDSYEYIQPNDENRIKDRVLLAGGIERLVPATGATWKVKRDGKLLTFNCPITSIVAVICVQPSEVRKLKRGGSGGKAQASFEHR